MEKVASMLHMVMANLRISDNLLTNEGTEMMGSIATIQMQAKR